MPQRFVGCCEFGAALRFLRGQVRCNGVALGDLLRSELPARLSSSMLSESSRAFSTPSRSISCVKLLAAMRDFANLVLEALAARIARRDGALRVPPARRASAECSSR